MCMYGYVRVSSRDQNEARQLIAMEEFGVAPELITVEKQSGRDFNRPKYQALVRKLHENDTLVIKSIDRLGRNYDEIIEQWRYITKIKKAAFVVLDMPLLDTRRGRDLTGTLIADIVLQLLSYVAQTEREFISYDEKPGIQAIATTSPDLPPREKNGATYRDYEYVRHGTLSLLAGLDLVTGEAIPLVRETHKSADFIDFLKILDSKYPKGDKIRLVLDNHSAHTSKETRAFLATIPGRFEFVFTPKHGSWLNMIEGFFGKMTNQMLRGIRVNSKEELKDRIYKYFDEVNATPVVYHWKYKMDEIDPDEKITVGLVI